MNWFVRVALALILLTIGSRGSAQAKVVHVWYRSAEGCPDGNWFVTRLSALGRQAQLASVGDTVDFVVTLGQAPETGASASVGRLERQTERGTVAIRELRGAECQDIAQALALSLDLALEPVANAPGAGKMVASRAVESRAAGPRGEQESKPMTKSGAGVSPTETARPKAAPRPARLLGLRIGLQGTLETGVAPAPLPGIALFAGIGGRGLPSARVAARVSSGASSAATTKLHVLLVTGRIEGCPVSWASKSISLETCAALDLGMLRADAPGPMGLSDSGVWFAGGALLGASVHLTDRWSIEGELGAVLPFVRYGFGPDVGSAQLFRTESIGLAGALGASWSIP